MPNGVGLCVLCDHYITFLLCLLNGNFPFIVDHLYIDKIIIYLRVIIELYNIMCVRGVRACICMPVYINVCSYK